MLYIRTYFPKSIITLIMDFDNGLWKVSPNIQYLLELFVISSNNQIMYKLLFILFIVKLYARINIFKRLKKHGQDIYKLSKTFENQVSKHRKIQCIFLIYASDFTLFKNK